VNDENAAPRLALRSIDNGVSNSAKNPTLFSLTSIDQTLLPVDGGETQEEFSPFLGCLDDVVTEARASKLIIFVRLGPNRFDPEFLSRLFSFAIKIE
jgi:hypothetical protein